MYIYIHWKNVSTCTCMRYMRLPDMMSLLISCLWCGIWDLPCPKYCLRQFCCIFLAATHMLSCQVLTVLCVARHVQVGGWVPLFSLRLSAGFWMQWQCMRQRPTQRSAHPSNLVPCRLFACIKTPRSRGIEPKELQCLMQPSVEIPHWWGKVSKWLWVNHPTVL